MRWTRVHTAITAVVVVVALVVAGLFVWGPLGSSDKPRDIGAGVRAEGKSLPKGLHAVTADVVPQLNLQLFTPVSHSYEITPPGKLPAATAFRLPLAAAFPPDEGYMLLPLTAESPEGPWTPLLSKQANGSLAPAIRLSPDSLSAYITTDHLSFFTIVKVAVGRVIDVVKDAGGKVIGGVKTVLDLMAQSFHSLTENLFYEAKPPTCENEAGALDGSYSITKPTRDTVFTCFGLENGVRVLKVVNHRRYPLLLHYTGMTVLDDGSSFRMRLAQLTRAVSGPDSVLFPGEQITYKVDLPKEGGTARLSAEFEGRAQSLYSLEVALRLALQFMTNFGAGSGNAVNGAILGQSDLLDKMDKLLQNADCGSLIFDHSTVDFGEVLKRCAGPSELLSTFGKNPLALVAAPVLVVAPVIAYFKSQFNALGDLLNDRDKAEVVITRADTAKLCPNGAANCPDAGAADLDGDGRMDQISLVVNPQEDSCGYYEARAVLATGQEVSGGVCFSWGPMVDPVYKKTELSFVGFAPINGTKGDEIVIKLKYWTDDPFYSLGPFQTWSVIVLTLEDYSGGNFKLEPPEVGAGWFPYYTYDIHLDGWEANGFQCDKSADGTPKLVWWSINVIDSQTKREYEYTVTKTVFVPSQSYPSDFEQAQTGGSSQTFPL
ncbi:MAG TPA: hypothetical protein VLA88_05700, partial [Candidatus Saccharimonadales bacterium]|nr:hypothetical protein [Candidatus Saccharimonadales bacterium]